MFKALFRTKDITKVRDVSGHTKLAKVLGPFDLISMGIGTIMGSGIFVMTGINAAEVAGPAVIVSLLLAAITAIFIGLVYTEVASAIPSSGGAYTYTYASLGELPAFLVAWIYLFMALSGITTVAGGFSGYLTGLLTQLGVNVPQALTSTYFEGGIINIPAMLICLLMASILIKGTKESITLNTILVFVKLFAAFLFLGLAFPNFKLENWSNFTPFGFKGVVTSAGALFFAYSGFDTVANAAEECKNPTRDIVIGLIGSLVICALIYILIAGMLTGVTNYAELGTPEPLSYALRQGGSGIGSLIVAACIMAGMTTVILCMTYSQTRISMAMARDHLFPGAFSIVHPKYHTPYIGTIFFGLLAAIVAGVVPVKILGSLTSITLLSMLLVVIIAAMNLRRTKPTLKRPFKCPFLPFIGSAAVICCGYLIISLFASVGLIFSALVALGVIVYFLYSKRRVDTRLAKEGLSNDL